MSESEQHDASLAELDMPADSLEQIDLTAVVNYISFRVPILRNAITAFLRSVGPLFYSYTREKVDEVLNRISQAPTQALASASMCEICSLTTIGSQYARQHMPPEWEIQIHIVAKSTLKSCIDEAPLRAMKVHTLLALYNINKDTAVASAHVESGVGLANKLGLHSDDPQRFDPVEWADAKKVWRTLLFCNGWMEPTLGYASGWRNLSEGFKRFSIEDMENENNLDSEDSVQVEIMKVIKWKANFLHDIAYEPSSVDPIHNIGGKRTMCIFSI
ncbi:hypothetical protein H2203_005235 [Taxawa tesnikishii (nom. ined.)]|nr:hypothetical protein H2203_005235 [Dothideales sp. JES 119]